MSRGARLGLIAAAIAVAVAAFLIARPGDDDDNGNGASRSAETTTQAEPGLERPPVNGHGGREPEPQVETIRVRGGRPVGGVRKLRVEKGEEVRFVVTADASEEVHVHGYDVFEDVRPGKSARVRFDADIDGIFEIELEGSHTQIAELRVEP
jgi:hypothetical protein